MWKGSFATPPKTTTGPPDFVGFTPGSATAAPETLAAPANKKKWKPDVAPADLVIACVFNTLFTTLAAADLSATYWTAAEPSSRLGFLVQYQKWRIDMPLIGSLLLFLLVLLPVPLIGMVSGALQAVFGWRRATLTRHVFDCIELAGLGSIIFTIATAAGPITETFMAACPATRKSKVAGQIACEAALADLESLHVAFVLLNLVMFVAPIVKYAKGNAGALMLSKEA